MSDQFLGEIRIFGFNFAPIGWALCDGQILPISQNAALFSLLGTNYGGNGTSNFGLPNLQGSAPVDQGQGPGLSIYNLGDTGGVTTVTLDATQIPNHTHPVHCLATNGDSGTPVGNAWAAIAGGRGALNLYAATANATMNAGATGAAGGGQPHNNMAPYLVLCFCIALQGIFPTRN